MPDETTTDNPTHPGVRLNAGPQGEWYRHPQVIALLAVLGLGSVGAAVTQASKLLGVDELKVAVKDLEDGEEAAARERQDLRYQVDNHQVVISGLSKTLEKIDDNVLILCRANPDADCKE